jgi:hypothetical protein
LTGASGVGCEFFNTGTLASIQTRSAIPFTIQTNELERLRITPGGLVGIGTSSVNALLEVKSSIADSEVQRIEGNFSGTGSVTLTNWRREGGAVAAAFKYNDVTSPLCMSIGTTTSHQFRIRTADTDAITIDTSQRVGIGTTSPQSLLNISTASTAGDQNVLICGTVAGGVTGSHALYLGAYGSTQYGCKIKSIYNYNANVSTQLSFEVSNAGTLTEAARIDSSGRLLVGTSSARSNIARYGADYTPATQLHTNVTSNWDTGLSLINYSAGGYAPVLTLGLSASNTAMEQMLLFPMVTEWVSLPLTAMMALILKKVLVLKPL